MWNEFLFLGRMGGRMVEFWFPLLSHPHLLRLLYCPTCLESRMNILGGGNSLMTPKNYTSPIWPRISAFLSLLLLITSLRLICMLSPVFISLLLLIQETFGKIAIVRPPTNPTTHSVNKLHSANTLNFRMSWSPLTQLYTTLLTTFISESKECQL